MVVLHMACQGKICMGGQLLQTGKGRDDALNISIRLYTDYCDAQELALLKHAAVQRTCCAGTLRQVA